MNNYVPFLKLKVNEVGALGALADDIKRFVTPFFDIPKQKDGATNDTFIALVNKAARSVQRNLGEGYSFFLDNFDIDDTLRIDGKNNYAYVIESFKDLNFIPVVGLDRTVERNRLVFQYKASGVISANVVAIRLLAEDFLSFDLVFDEISDLVEQGKGLFHHWILVLDNRVCANVDAATRAGQIVQFVKNCTKVFGFDAIIFTGSSIPASIKDLLEVESERTYERVELEIYKSACSHLPGASLTLGDYTIVSPLYSEFTIPPAAMRNIMTPKIFYSHANMHYVARGGALRTHARGDLQYNDIAAHLIGQPFYRGPAYSFGSLFLFQKAHGQGKKVTPSSILKPTINAHMTFMVRDYLSLV